MKYSKIENLILLLLSSKHTTANMTFTLSNLYTPSWPRSFDYCAYVYQCVSLLVFVGWMSGLRQVHWLNFMWKKLVIDLRQDDGFLQVLQFHRPIKPTDDITEILLKVALATQNSIISIYSTLLESHASSIIHPYLVSFVTRFCLLGA